MGYLYVFLIGVWLGVCLKPRRGTSGGYQARGGPRNPVPFGRGI